jgi:hypothetical protein
MDVVPPLSPCSCARAEGGRGALALADAVIRACEAARGKPSPVKFLYPLDMPIKVGYHALE